MVVGATTERSLVGSVDRPAQPLKGCDIRWIAPEAGDRMP